MLNVTVIGFGMVGASLSLLLLNNTKSIRLNILEPDTEKAGAFLDFQHGMSLYPNKEFHVNDFELFEAADFIFYTAGIANIHGESRLSTANKNRVITHELFDNRTFKNLPYVIVITNPVDVISHEVMLAADLPSNRIIGTGAFLDSVRLSYYLSTLSAYPQKDIDAFVLGEHGNSQFAAYSMTTVDKKPINKLDSFTKSKLEEAQELTKNAAFQIRETQKATMYGVAKCAEEIFNYLLQPQQKLVALSFLTNAHYNKLLNLEKSIFISMPTMVSNKGVQIIDGIELTKEEISAFQQSAQLLFKTIHND